MNTHDILITVTRKDNDPKTLRTKLIRGLGIPESRLLESYPK